MKYDSIYEYMINKYELYQKRTTSSSSCEVASRHCAQLSSRSRWPAVILVDAVGTPVPHLVHLMLTLAQHVQYVMYELDDLMMLTPTQQLLHHTRVTMAH